MGEQLKEPCVILDVCEFKFVGREQNKILVVTSPDHKLEQWTTNQDHHFKENLVDGYWNPTSDDDKYWKDVRDTDSIGTLDNWNSIRSARDSITDEHYWYGRTIE